MNGPWGHQESVWKRFVHAPRDLSRKYRKSRASLGARHWRRSFVRLDRRFFRRLLSRVSQRYSRYFEGPGPRVLIVDTVFPRVDRDAGSVEARNIARILKAIGYEVTFAAPTDGSQGRIYRSQLEREGIRCCRPNGIDAFEVLLKDEGRTFDICVIFRVYPTGEFFELIRKRCPKIKIIFHTIDLHHLRMMRDARLNGDRIALHYAHGTAERELYLGRLADATIVVSDFEERLLEAALPGANVHLIPLSVECPDRQYQFDNRNGIGFVGGFKHEPNVDAVRFFLQEIWPLVRSHIPDAKFHVIGSDIPLEFKSDNERGVIIVGHVPDLQPELDQLRITVAPLRYGAGMKGKVITSMAHGVPCVITPIAAEGLGVVDGTDILIREHAEDFARAVVDLHQHHELWDSLSESGVAYIKENHSLKIAEQRFRTLLTSIGADLPHKSKPN